MSIGTQTQGDTNSLKGKPFEPLSPGSYPVALDRVMNKEGKNTKPGQAGPAKYVELSFKVTEGEHKGRLIFGPRYFYENVSPKAIEISIDQANKLLKSLGVNGGMEAIGDDLHAIEDFVGKEVVAKLDVEYPQGYKARNIVKGFSRR